jgi:hypothetical protein
MKKVSAVFLGACLAVFFAVPAFAQTTPAEVKTSVINEATPYFTILIGIVVALFGLALLVTLAKKAARMGKGAISRG